MVEGSAAEPGPAVDGPLQAATPERFVDGSLRVPPQQAHLDLRAAVEGAARRPFAAGAVHIHDLAVGASASIYSIPPEKIHGWRLRTGLFPARFEGYGWHEGGLQAFCSGRLEFFLFESVVVQQ